MADGGPRSVAEKLAAAKKKHKAYLKEKGLKNAVSKGKDQQNEDGIFGLNSRASELSQEQVTERKIDDVNLNEVTDPNSRTDPPNTNIYEADLPLPQYSMDYNNQNQGSSLPDPLSFFDNFSNVGVSFQSFAQPLTSFFNNSSHSHSDNTEELPNQILVEEKMSWPTNSNEKGITNNCNLQNDGNAQQIFSYDRFRSNAVNNVFTDNNIKQEDKDNFEIKQIPELHKFDEFSNSNGAITDSKIQGPYLYKQENFSVPFQKNSEILNKKQEENIPNPRDNSLDIDSSKNIQENLPVMLTMNPNIKVYPNTENHNFDNNVEYEFVNKNGENPSSNIIALQKMSDEMEELIKQEENLPYLNDELGEKHNEELSLLLDQQTAKCAQLSSQLRESEMKYSKLLTDFSTLEIQKEEIETSLNLKADMEVHNDLSKLREDLQCHLQTIGMLVAEKTELSALLSETQAVLKHESSQCIDLQSQIKEMKLFYSDLEHELEVLKSEKLNLNYTQKEQVDLFNKMSEDYNDMKNRYEELTQDLLESKEKLQSTTESNLNLQKQVKELDHQLSLANVKIQQLTLTEPSQQNSEIEKLMQDKLTYETHISYLNDTLKTISKEREESSLQYQQYAEQLNAQISNLATKLEQYQKEIEQLKIQEENRVRHIGELEKQLQNVQNDSTSFNLKRNNSFLKKELESSTELAKNLQTEKDELNTNLTKVLIDKELLQKEIESYKFSITQLESTVEQLRGSQPDNAVLLATMESDKVAASRAISQNNELKRQMEGMQEVLLKVNNDNVQLTENISLERKTNKDLLEKLQKTEISFQTVAEAIEIKDKELVNLRDQLERMDKQCVQHEQLSDRLRHYEAQNHSNSSLQSELQGAKQMIAHLTTELNILKQNQLNQTNQNTSSSLQNELQVSKQLIAHLTTELNILKQNQMNQTNQNTQTNQSEDDRINGAENPDVVYELKTQLSNLQIRNKELESLLQNLHTSQQLKSVDTNGNESLDKDTAMKHLEKKFLRTMEEIARLTEEKQRLEHLVLQLQGETETIGEYVTLYQQQRSILKQRTLEKDQQLQQLTNDRESIKVNIDRLNNLVSKLIIEKGAITKELLKEHEHFSKERSDLCEEHQKMHQEINKITSDGLKNSGTNDSSNTEIAEEIISLLSEIKSSNLVQPVESIHHCPWCSGKLITV